MNDIFVFFVFCFSVCLVSRQANKGIYVDKTPAEGAVERAHLKHTLAHGLAHRPDLAELSHKGVYLEVGLGVGLGFFLFCLVCVVPTRICSCFGLISFA